jgi:hypothetical protein
VFHSSVNSVGHARELPTKLSIPIDADEVQAVYILHGCGYAKYHKTFATYRFLRGRKEIDSVDLVSYGQPQAGGNAASQPTQAAEDEAPAISGTLGEGPAREAKPSAVNQPQPNIQDWWPDFPHMDFAHARMAPIMESRPEDSAFQHVYLYTLEWVNPQPFTKITHLEVSVDPTQSTTLGMLAVTVLRK